MTAAITLILGGARSGKSSYALRLAQEGGTPVTFIATAAAGDEEMRQRIIAHQAERPADWQTIEASQGLGAARVAQPFHPVVILDCLTMHVSNLLLQYPDPDPDALSNAEFEQAIDLELDALLALIKGSNSRWLIISNETGLGVVPAFKLGRLFRDGLGRANQRLAAAADEVVFLVAGLPMKVK